MKNWVALILLFAASNVFALDCDGKITEIYSYPAQCNGHYAYKTDNNNSRWFCAQIFFPPLHIEEMIFKTT